MSQDLLLYSTDSKFIYILQFLRKCILYIYNIIFYRADSGENHRPILDSSPPAKVKHFKAGIKREYNGKISRDENNGPKSSNNNNTITKKK